MKKFILIMLVLLAVMSITSCASYETVRLEHLTTGYYPVGVEWGFIIFLLVIALCAVLWIAEAPILCIFALCVVAMGFYWSFQKDGDYFIHWSNKNEYKEAQKDYKESSFFEKMFYY